MTDTPLPVWKLRLTDLWWLLAFPVYQTFGTIRHEGSHALAAKLEGGNVLSFTPYPTTSACNRFTWGCTHYTGGGWFIDAAPYLNDLIWFAIFFFVLTRINWRNHAVWLNLMIVGLLSPLVNSLFNWVDGIFGSDQTDVAKWASEDPAVLVHLYFIVTISAYVVALVAILWRVPKPVVEVVLPAQT